MARRRTAWAEASCGAAGAVGTGRLLGKRPPEATELCMATEQPEATEWSMATEQPEATEPSCANPAPEATLVGSATAGPVPTPAPEPPWPVVAGPNAGGVGAAVARAVPRAAAVSGGSVVWVVVVPEEPVEPESPDRATGMYEAVELAGPVSPVLVAED